MKRNLRHIGVAIDDTIIRRMTLVKYTGLRSPTDNPFWDTIRATSPLVIIPIPIFNESLAENLHSLATAPQAIIFVNSATRTKAMENHRICAEKSAMSVLRPILAKNTGPNSIYELISIFSAI